MDRILIKIAVCLSVFMVSGLATTNILRLTRGYTLHVYSSKCSCPNCGMKIGPLNQMPMISYVANRGRCRKCKSPIPKDALFLEIAVFVGMNAIIMLTGYSYLGVALSFLYYEAVRVVCLVRFGRRERNFASQYVLAVLAILLCMALILFQVMLLHII